MKKIIRHCLFGSIAIGASFCMGGCYQHAVTTTPGYVATTTTVPPHPHGVARRTSRRTSRRVYRRR